MCPFPPQGKAYTSIAESKLIKRNRDKLAVKIIILNFYLTARFGCVNVLYQR